MRLITMHPFNTLVCGRARASLMGVSGCWTKYLITSYKALPATPIISPKIRVMSVVSFIIFPPFHYYYIMINFGKNQITEKTLLCTYEFFPSFLFPENVTVSAIKTIYSMIFIRKHTIYCMSGGFFQKTSSKMTWM
jgi:hypothetical protein